MEQETQRNKLNSKNLDCQTWLPFSSYFVKCEEAKKKKSIYYLLQGVKEDRNTVLWDELKCVFIFSLNVWGKREAWYYVVCCIYLFL